MDIKITIDDRIVNAVKMLGTRRGAAGVVALMTLGSAVAWAAVPNSFADGDVISAAEMNANFKAITDELDKLNATLAEADPDCPPGYKSDGAAGAGVLCKRGADEVVKVAHFWIDRYEGAIVDPAFWANGDCNGEGTLWGQSTAGGDYPDTFPDSGSWTKPLHACSVPGVVASTRMTWSQAQQACVLSGKRLCTDGEWTAAAAGTPENTTSWPDTNPADGCTGPGSTDQCSTCADYADIASYPKTGDTSACVSSWGVYDMVGTHNEWIGAVSYDTPSKKPLHIARGGGQAGGLEETGVTFTEGSAGTWLTFGFRCCRSR